jgi:hypothetical protein
MGKRERRGGKEGGKDGEKRRSGRQEVKQGEAPHLQGERWRRFCLRCPLRARHVVLPQLVAEELRHELAQGRLLLEHDHKSLVQHGSDGGLLAEGAPDEAKEFELELERGGGRGTGGSGGEVEGGGVRRGGSGGRVCGWGLGGDVKKHEEAVNSGEPEFLLPVEHGLAEEHDELIAKFGSLALKGEQRAEHRGGDGGGEVQDVFEELKGGRGEGVSGLEKVKDIFEQLQGGGGG